MNDIIWRTFCPQWRADETHAYHIAYCPVCQLLVAEKDMTTTGDVRRPYASKENVMKNLKKFGSICINQCPIR